MGFLDASLWGIHIWILLYLAFSVVAFVGFIIWLNRARIKELYIKWRWPEQVIKVVIHHKGGLYTKLWRLIPESSSFSIGDKVYYFNDKSLVKENELIIRQDPKSGNTLMVDGKPYKLTGVPIKAKGNSYPEIHYKFNNPNPIDFDISSDKIMFSSVDMKDFKENNLFRELLTMQDNKNMMVILMIIGGVNLLLSLFIVATIKGWIK
jgi:hypothetical protein